MLTRLTAARPWQIVRNNIGRQAPWAWVHHLLRSATGTEEMIDMVAWIESTEVRPRGWATMTVNDVSGKKNGSDSTGLEVTHGAAETNSTTARSPRVSREANGGGEEAGRVTGRV
jgi:hypothetical protein